jgi:hypothetical protein
MISKSNPDFLGKESNFSNPGAYWGRELTKMVTTYFLLSPGLHNIYYRKL